MSLIRRFVTPEVVRLKLSGDDYIDIKRELNAGEANRVFGRMVKEFRAGQAAELDPELVGRTKVVEYLLGWSFTDEAGTPVPVSESALDNLTSDTYFEIVTAIDAHEAALEKEKNVPTSSTA